MPQANRKTKVTVAQSANPAPAPVAPAPVAPAPVAPAPVVKSAYTPPAVLLAPAAPQVASALAVLRASLGVAPAAPAPVAPAPVAPAPVTRAQGVSARTLQTWGRSVPATNKANLLIPKVSANFAPHQTITVLVNNPKAQGKGPATRFALYGGQGATLTVAAYLAVCAKHGIPTTVTHADLMWDFNHGYISVA